MKNYRQGVMRLFSDRFKNNVLKLLANMDKKYHPIYESQLLSISALKQDK